MKQNLFLPSGYRLEFWASGEGSFCIDIDGKTVWQIPSIANHPEFFKYHHREACEVTIVTNAPDAVLWAYGYQPQTVNDAGITVLEFSEAGIFQRTGAEIEDWLRSDPERPVLHFSPIRQWMNDPNGLCKIGDTWHVFYQFHPASTDWGPMHWGHATSKDLFNWTHLPVFMHPEQNYWQLGATGGAISGNAFEDRDGSRMFFYTERLPAYDLFNGYREVQKIARPGPGLLAAEAISLIIEDRPEGVEHDFRDPKVWWDEGAQAYRMVLGAALYDDPAVLLYGSDDLHKWSYLGPLYRAPSRFREEGARAVECPDFFRLDGKWVLVMGFVGHTDPASGRHNLLYALVGEFEHDRFVPDREELQLLDFGTDFYAMQSFEADGRQIAMAWLFNWEYRKPAGSPYSGELSLPREVSLDRRGRVCLNPTAEFDALPRLAVSSELPCCYPLTEGSFEVAISSLPDSLVIEALQGDHMSFKSIYQDGKFIVTLPQDDGSIRYAADIAPGADFRIVYDRGILEIFGEKGAVCGTRRGYRLSSPDKLVFRPALPEARVNLIGITTRK
jgi:beta-fructofuranosidase